MDFPKTIQPKDPQSAEQVRIIALETSVSLIQAEIKELQKQIRLIAKK